MEAWTLLFQNHPLWWWWRPLQGDFNEVDCFCWILSNSKLLSANHRGRRASLQSKQFLAPGKATYQERQQSCWRFPWICKNLSRLHWLVYQESGSVTPIKWCQIDVKVVPRKAIGQFISCSTARQWKDGKFTYFSSQLFLFFRWKEQFEFFLVKMSKI